MRASRKMRRSLAGVLTASLAAFTATACGAEGSDGSDGSQGAEGIDDRSVTVAIVSPRSGPVAPTFGGFAEAAQARFDVANDAGGVNGRKVEVVVIDDAGDGTKQVTAGRSAIESKDAFAVIMGSTVDTMLPFMKQRKVPVLGYPGQPAYASDPNMFGAYGVPPIHYASTALPLGLQKRGVTKLALFAHNSPGGVALLKSVAAGAKRIGMDVVLEQSDVPQGSFDATSLALRMKEVGADGAFVGTASGATISILDAAKQQNVSLKATYASTVRSVLSTEPDLLEGTLSPPLGTVALASDVPAAQAYVAAMKKYAPEVNPHQGLLTQVGWVAADLFLTGLEKAGDKPTRSSFIENLRQVTDYDADGLLVEPITFAEGVEPNGNPLKCVWFEQAKNGAYVADPEPTCGELFKLPGLGRTFHALHANWGIMIGYIVAGLVTGGIYAISAIAMVTTYNASRVFNFGQAGIAFFIAYCYYFLTTSVDVPPILAAAVCVLLIGPALGVVLWALLLERLGRASQQVRVAGTIGLQLALTALTILMFGREEVFSVPRLLGDANTVLTVAGVRISDDQLLVMGAAAAVAATAAFVLQRTTVGLITRGAVDSRLMTSLTGTNPALVTAGTWAVGSSLAGLAGILVAPRVGLDAVSISSMVVTSFAAVVIGKLTNLWRACLGAVLIGVLQSVLLPILPSEGILSIALRPSVPFLLLALALLVYSRQSDVRSDDRQREAAKSQSAIEQKEAHLAALMRGDAGRWDRYVGWIVLVVLIVSFPMLATSAWVGFVALGLAFSLTFLSYRLVTGELGVISLGQVAFAGIGAISTGQFMLEGWSFWASAAVGVLIAAAAGLVLGLVCLKLADLYAAIATFGFAMLVAEVVFTMPRFSNFESGVFVDRPSLAGYYFGTDVSFYYLMIGLLAVVMLLLTRLRKSTVGLAFSTILASRVRAETLGISTFGARLGVFALGAGLAALGGAMIASYLMVALPKSFLPSVGLIWFAASIAQGARSMGGLVFAGLLLAVMPLIFDEYLPHSLEELPPLLFGLLAIVLVSQPAGINVHLRGSMREIAVGIESKWRRRQASSPESTQPDAPSDDGSLAPANGRDRGAA